MNRAQGRQWRDEYEVAAARHEARLWEFLENKNRQALGLGADVDEDLL